MKKTILFLCMAMLGWSIVSCGEDDDIGSGEQVIPDESFVDTLATNAGVEKHNLYYNETQLGITQNYWVVLDDETQAETVKWYVDGKEEAKGEDFAFTPTKAGVYVVKCMVGNAGKEFVSKVYTSPGVYILNEPNMTAVTTAAKGINRYIYGEENITRFVKGNNENFGVTSQYIANWNGRLYVVAPDPADQGTSTNVSFACFNATNGDFIKSYNKQVIKGTVHAFAGITADLGVLTTSSGAYLVNLKDFTVANESLKSSSGAGNAFVSDGYLFLICNKSVVAYEIADLSTETEPKVLGSATAGFVKTKNGIVWAANGGSVLGINTKDLSTKKITIPDGVNIEVDASVWSQVPWIASAKDNVFYFAKSSKEVYKYDIDSGELTYKFVDTRDDMSGYMLYRTSLYYDAERNELLCQGLKDFANDADYNGIWGFDALSGERSFEFLYDTTDREIYEYRDMFFPCMLAPIKNY